MGDDQKELVLDLIEKAECAVNSAVKAQKMFARLIWVFASTIVVLLITIGGLGYQTVYNANDIKYVRESAFHKDAGIDLIETNQALRDALTTLITDTNSKEAVKMFNDKTNLIIARIMSREMEIVPRGLTID